MQQCQEQMLKEAKAEVAAYQFDLSLRNCSACHKEFKFNFWWEDRCEDCEFNAMVEDKESAYLSK